MTKNNRPILITGSQRSGTTLINLILDSHPQIVGIDEMQFKAKNMSEYLGSEEFHPYVAFKLPTVSHEVASFKELDNIKVIWCMRDPRDVALSMIQLKLKLNPQSKIEWIFHPLGGTREIRNCITVLGYTLIPERLTLLDKYSSIMQKQPSERSREDMVFNAALCWRLKHELLDIYQRLSVDYKIVYYEKLVSEPENSIQDLLDFIDLPWHDNVTKHHKLHDGKSVGNTDNTKEIDSSNTGKWVNQFNDTELNIIQSVCGDIATKYGYDLN